MANNITLQDKLQFKLQLLDTSKLSKLLHLALPSTWAHAQAVVWNRDEPTVEWLNTLWSFVDSDKNYSALGTWPLIPTTTHLVSVQHANSVLYIGYECPAPLRALLEKVGCHIYAPIVSVFPLSLLSKASASGICAALGAISGIENFVFSVEEAAVSFLSLFTCPLCFD